MEVYHVVALSIVHHDATLPLPQVAAHVVRRHTKPGRQQLMFTNWIDDLLPNKGYLPWQRQHIRQQFQKFLQEAPCSYLGFWVCAYRHNEDTPLANPPTLNVGSVMLNNKEFHIVAFAREKQPHEPFMNIGSTICNLTPYLDPAAVVNQVCLSNGHDFTGEQPDRPDQIPNQVCRAEFIRHLAPHIPKEGRLLLSVTNYEQPGAQVHFGLWKDTIKEPVR